MLSLLSKSVITIVFRIFCLNMLFTHFWVSYNIEKIQTCRLFHSWKLAILRFSLLSNLKTIAFTVFCIIMLFSYIWVSYNIVKLQTCSLWHSWVISTLMLSLLSKSIVTWKLLQLENFVLICYSPTYGSAITVKFQTCSLFHSWGIVILRFSLLSKWVVTWKLLHLQYFV